MFQEMQETIHHHFRQVKLLETALTHSSYAHEHGEAEHNERLEYLGDAALELAISEELFARHPHAREGELTRMRSALVSQPSLAAMAVRIGLPSLLRLGKGEEVQGGRERPSLLSDAMEAVLGAVMVDGGYAAVRKSVVCLFADLWPESEKSPRDKDAKSRLQELTQRLFKERPVYALTSTEGPEHAKIFTVTVTLPDGRAYTGQGPSMKRAEQNVAVRALEMLIEESR